MIVRLTHAQGRAVIDKVGGLHADEMMRGRKAYGRKQHDYLLPAIAWKQVYAKMQEDAYGPNGGMKTDRRRSYYTALGRLAASIAEMENHPALFSKGLMGAHHDVIPVWARGLGVYDPYPMREARFVVLMPVAKEINCHTITEWVETPEVEGSILLHPGAHWRYMPDD